MGKQATQNPSTLRMLIEVIPAALIVYVLGDVIVWDWSQGNRWRPLFTAFLPLSCGVPAAITLYRWSRKSAGPDQP